MTAEREIYSFPKNSTEVVKAVIAEFKGHIYVAAALFGGQRISRRREIDAGPNGAETT
jgi:hypothetical protein